MKGKAKVVLWILFVLTVTVLAVKYSPVKVLWVTSGSMEPALKEGNLLFVNTRADLSKVKKGDIIVFDLVGGLRAAHRVISREGEGLLTKGDANPAPDLFLVTKENFYGVVMGFT